MEIVIKIPKEFEDELKKDRFKDSLARVASDIESFGFQLAGRYEQETITMLRKAFRNCTPLPEGHGRLIDGDKVLDDIIKKNPASVSKTEKSKEYARLVYYWAVKNAPTIIEAEGSDAG